MKTLHRLHDDALIGLAVAILLALGVVHAVGRAGAWLLWLVLGCVIAVALIPSLIVILAIRVFLPKSIPEGENAEA